MAMPEQEWKDWGETKDKKFSISELKRALVEVSELCANLKCSSCPLAKWDEVNVPYCPLIENEDGIRHDYPYEWDNEDWKEQEE